MNVTPVLPGPTDAVCEERGGVEVEKEGEPLTAQPVCTGKEGSPWTDGGNLPPGATETGTWSFNGTAADTDGVYAPIGFPILLAPPQLPRNQEGVTTRAHYETDADFSTFCGDAAGGSATLPAAKPGELCVYVREVKNATFDAMTRVLPVTEAEGALRSGTLLHFNMSGVGYGFGTWAVTGCGEGVPCP